LTRWTITDPQTFIRHLEKVRRDGYATNLREYSEQVRSVGAPIFAPDGSAIASISIAAPAERMTAPTMRKLTRLLCSAAQEISAKMRSPTNVVNLYSAPRQRNPARARRSPGRTLQRVQA
jgi:IclR family transcriptional regulator, acetate operon repressor